MKNWKSGWIIHLQSRIVLITEFAPYFALMEEDSYEDR